MQIIIIPSVLVCHSLPRLTWKILGMHFPKLQRRWAAWIIDHTSPLILQQRTLLLDDLTEKKMNVKNSKPHYFIHINTHLTSFYANPQRRYFNPVACMNGQHASHYTNGAHTANFRVFLRLSWSSCLCSNLLISNSINCILSSLKQHLISLSSRWMW